MIVTGKWKLDMANFRAWRDGELVLDPSQRALKAYREHGDDTLLYDAIVLCRRVEGVPRCLFNRLMDEIGRGDCRVRPIIQ